MRMPTTMMTKIMTINKDRTLRMHLVIKCLIVAGVLVSPCVYDATSREPSPAAGIIALGGPLLEKRGAYPDIHGRATNDSWGQAKQPEENS